MKITIMLIEYKDDGVLKKMIRNKYKKINMIVNKDDRERMKKNKDTRKRDRQIWKKKKLTEKKNEERYTGKGKEREN